MRLARDMRSDSRRSFASAHGVILPGVGADLAAELLPDPDDAAGADCAAGAPAWPAGSGTDSLLVSLWGLGC